jgi:DNA-binding MarR family transcriptional regulator
MWELYVASQRVGQLLDDELEGAEVAADDYALYSRLATHGPATPTELAGDLGVPRSTLMLRFRRLAERGHAMQIPNPVDGRSSLLTLTAEGRDAQLGTLPRFRTVMQEIADALERSPSEVAEVMAEFARAADGALRARRESKISERRRQAAEVAS